MKPVKIIVVGAGSRGTEYAKFAAECPDKMQIVGVAEPREWHRNNLKELYNIPAENVFNSWIDVVKRDKFADAVIISTQDSLHKEPALAFA